MTTLIVNVAEPLRLQINLDVTTYSVLPWKNSTKNRDKVMKFISLGLGIAVAILSFNVMLRV
jgi:hypothetical protein